MRRMALPFLLILSLSLLRSCPSSAFVPLTGPHRSSLLPMIDLSSNDNIDKLRESAERLRKEAKDLEDDLGNKRRSSPPMIIPVDPTYTNLAESTWTCTYRLSSDPRNEEEEDKQGPQCTCYRHGGAAVDCRNNDRCWFGFANNKEAMLSHVFIP